MADEQTWSDHLQQIETEMRTWRHAHPQASLTQIETELDRRLDAARARLLAEVAGDLPEERPVCPDCQRPMHRAGQHPRHLASRGDMPVTLSRTYWRCPACGGGLFPPG